MPKKSNRKNKREIDHKDAEALRELARSIVTDHKRFAWAIVSAWLQAHNSVILDDPESWVITPRL